MHLATLWSDDQLNSILLNPFLFDSETTFTFTCSDSLRQPQLQAQSLTSPKPQAVQLPGLYYTPSSPTPLFYPCLWFEALILFPICLLFFCCRGTSGMWLSEFQDFLMTHHSPLRSALPCSLHCYFQSPVGPTKIPLILLLILPILGLRLWPSLASFLTSIGWYWTILFYFLFFLISFYQIFLAFFIHLENYWTCRFLFVNRVGFLRGLILGKGVMLCIRSFTWLLISGSFFIPFDDKYSIPSSSCFHLLEAAIFLFGFEDSGWVCISF